MTWLEIVSDAVKIGLGGLIGALSAFVIARYNHKSTTARLVFERKSRMLIEASKVMEDFYKQALIFNASLMKLMSNKTGDAEALRKESSHQRDILNEKIGQCMMAEAQMLLLGEDVCKDKIAESMKIVGQLNRQIEFILPSKDVEWVRTSGSELEKARRNFYVEMRKAFGEV